MPSSSTPTRRSWSNAGPRSGRASSERLVNVATSRPGAGTLGRKFPQTNNLNAGYGAKHCHRNCLPDVLPVLYGGGELLLATGGAASTQRSNWLAALRPGYDLCGHPRLYALHGLD